MKKAAEKAVTKAKEQQSEAIAHSKNAPKKITDNGSAEVLAETLQTVSKARKAIDQQRKDTTQPLRDEKDEIDKAFNEILGPIEGAESGLKAEAIRWDDEQEEKIAAENKRREDAAAAAQAKADAEAHEEGREAEAVEPEPEVKKEAIRSLGGAVAPVSKIWDIEVVDASKIDRKFLVPDEVALRAYAKATDGKEEIPGVRVFKKKITSSR